MVYKYAIATFTCAAAITVASASAIKLVTLNAMPVPNLMPSVPSGIFNIPVAGIGRVKNGTDVPTVGAVAKLNNFKNAAAAPTFEAVTWNTVPAVALTDVAFVVAALDKLKAVGVVVCTMPMLRPLVASLTILLAFTALLLLPLIVIEPEVSVTSTRSKSKPVTVKR